MKVIINGLLGSAEVEFLREGHVVHRERFSGKTSTPYARTIRTSEQFDSHRLRFVTAMPDDWTFSYQVVESDPEPELPPRALRTVLERRTFQGIEVVA
jgi:hypothetical protein